MLLNNVLLVDDEPTFNFRHEKLVSALYPSAKTQCFLDAESALTWLKRIGKEIPTSEKPQLILLDIGLPKMNGVEFMDELEALPIYDKVLMKVFILSYTHDPVMHDWALFHPVCSGYITKPLTATNLKSALSQDFGS